MRHLSPHHRLALRLLHLSHLPHLYHLPVLQCSRVAPCSAEPFSCDVSSPSSASVAAPLPDSSPAVTATEVAPSGSDGPPLAFDPDPASRCTTTDMTTPPPSSSATVSRHHHLTRSRDGTRKPKVFSATHYPVPACFLALQSDASLTCFSQASKVPEWRASMQDEFNALLRALLFFSFMSMTYSLLEAM